MHRPYYLLTGATGLLGGYLMRDCVEENLRLAVLVRPTRAETASQRIHAIMSRWEKQAGYAMPRPVVLEGDISKPWLGLTQEQVGWVKRNCGGMIHNAASLTFVGEDRAGEPWVSNVDGTKRVLELCREAEIREMHHVSTSYVCGLRKGVCLESELDVGQEFGNAYEKSKVQAETMVREEACFDSITVHRPAIIVGDSKTGYTTTFHGLYAPLKIAHTTINKLALSTLSSVSWVSRLVETLNLNGSEHKNFVPVDWVSKVMSHVIARPKLHRTTYHLTPSRRVPIAEMAAVISETINEFSIDSEKVAKNNGSAYSGEFFEGFFREQMGVYEAYWRDDPIFDTTNTTQAAPHLPCPEVNREMLKRLCQFAVTTNFGWPRPQPPQAPFDVDTFLSSRFQRQNEAINGCDAVGLEVSGGGGGQWVLLLRNDQIVGVEQTMPEHAAGSLYLNSRTFEQLARRQTSVEQSVRTGNVLLQTGNGVKLNLESVLQGLIEQHDSA